MLYLRKGFKDSVESMVHWSFNDLEPTYSGVIEVPVNVLRVRLATMLSPLAAVVNAISLVSRLTAVSLGYLIEVHL